MQLEKITKGSIAIALGNIVPLIGVLLGYWSAFDIIFLYWFENIIIGLFTVLRMTVRPNNRAGFVAAGVFAAAFFCFHYGFFTYIHGVFVASFFADHLINDPQSVGDGIFNLAAYMLAQKGVQLTILAMVLVHLVEYVIAYREHKIDSPREEMSKPYKRIMVLHMTILFGGFIATMFENTLGVALLIVALKIYYDLKPPVFYKKKQQSKEPDVIKPNPNL